jgi:hypothetical protein
MESEKNKIRNLTMVPVWVATVSFTQGFSANSCEYDQKGLPNEGTGSSCKVFTGESKVETWNGYPRYLESNLDSKCKLKRTADQWQQNKKKTNKTCVYCRLV